MAEQAVEIVIVAILFSAILLFWFGLCHLVYLAYCPRCCGERSLENNSDRSQGMLHVTEEARETVVGYQEDQGSTIVYLATDLFSK